MSNATMFITLKQILKVHPDWDDKQVISQALDRGINAYDAKRLLPEARRDMAAGDWGGPEIA